jgi:hypothetical protein
MDGIDALISTEGGEVEVNLTTDSPMLEMVLRHDYAKWVAEESESGEVSAERRMDLLLGFVETRLAVSEALNSSDPEPAFIAVLQRAHADVADEIDGEVTVWRSVIDGADPFHPNQGPYGVDMRADSDRPGTGVTSWWDWDTGKDATVPERKKLIDAAESADSDLGIAEITVGEDRVLGRIGDMRNDGEVLVANSPNTVRRLMAGTFPIVAPENRMSPFRVTAVVELACRSAECAPPPVGRGGSLPQSSGISDRVRETVEDAKAVGSSDPRNEGYDTARAFMASREEAMARRERDTQGRGDHVSDPIMDGYRAEFDALSAAVPLADGMARRGTEAAKRLESQARAALPGLKSFVIVGDVNDRVATEVIDVLSEYPEEARAEIESLVLGRYPEPDKAVVAAWGGHADESGPYNTLWVTPKLLGATDAEIAEGVGVLGKPSDRASEFVTIMMAEPERRHKIAIAHEMGHVLHAKAIRQGKWQRYRGMTANMKEDPVVRQVTQPGGRSRPIMTTKYGETNTAETVAESFALAALDGFDNITAEQQAVVRQVLDRAFGRPELNDEITDLQFAADPEDDDEYGQGERFKPLTDTFQLPTE